MNRIADGKCQMGDPCPECQSGEGHPPMLSVYDPADGVYYLEPGLATCIARHDSSGRSYRAGGICGEPAVKWAGDVPLCRHHLRRLLRWISDDDDDATLKAAVRRRLRDHRLKLRHQEELHRQHLGHLAEEIAAAAEAKSSRSVVYYIRRTSDGAVKIGYSGALAQRRKALSTEHGPIRVLLVQGGDHKEELDAHCKWADYRTGRTEWFRPAQPLLKWICETRKAKPQDRLQPKDVLSVGELEQLALAAVPESALRRDDEGCLIWPPDSTA